MKHVNCTRDITVISAHVHLTHSLTYTSLTLHFSFTSLTYITLTTPTPVRRYANRLTQGKKR
ncbi:hypothetical protein E2C01_008681 [Portunus trituberculatus]|uniref:Uncharacterized protein n=1 Tax=Portunus trituberculatus TaxID=210409 RepID=A0A5B7D1G0_PORTR|nr:hypothetical protein [Portunus trituberculatus]